MLRSKTQLRIKRIDMKAESLGAGGQQLQFSGTKCFNDLRVPPRKRAERPTSFPLHHAVQPGAAARRGRINLLLRRIVLGQEPPAGQACDRRRHLPRATAAGRVRVGGCWRADDQAAAVERRSPLDQQQRIGECQRAWGGRQDVGHRSGQWRLHRTRGVIRWEINWPDHPGQPGPPTF